MAPTITRGIEPLYKEPLFTVEMALGIEPVGWVVMSSQIHQVQESVRGSTTWILNYAVARRLFRSCFMKTGLSSSLLYSFGQNVPQLFFSTKRRFSSLWLKQVCT